VFKQAKNGNNFFMMEVFIMKKFFYGKNAAVTAMCASIVIVFIVLCAKYIEQKNIRDGIADKVLRFHVIANSDSAEDQTIKLAVRDAVGSYMAGVLDGVSCEAECEKLVTAENDKIVEIARNVIDEYGADYGVTASLSESEFPLKQYGEYLFPAGNYRALKVVLGDGGGANWWCVMFPNMCFRGSVYEVVSDEAGESLRAVLSKEEYEKVLFSGNYDIKFKYLSFLNR
jgi:stage II sporulation protein R